jgi:predicted lipid-binding transport protein (Tim44 family)
MYEDGVLEKPGLQPREVYMADKKWLRYVFLCITGLFFLFYVLEIDSFARVGGSRSSGFRGSRSYSSPSRTAPSSPYSPSRSYQSPSQQGGGIFGGGGGGFLRSMAGGIAGGFLGSMLFRGLGFAGGGGGWGGGGIGLFEIIILAVILYLVYRFIKRRRQASMETAYYQSSPMQSSSYQPSYDQGYGAAGSADSDVQSGLRYIRQMDPAFDEARFGETGMDNFFKIQGAWAARDMSSVRNLLTDEMYHTLQGDADKLRAEKKFNKLDNVAVRSTDIVEAWQESGKDYITVRFLANLVDYTVDETSGQVVAGSRTEPVKFEEYWTFVRPVGSNPWQLSAITQPQ